MADTDDVARALVRLAPRFHRWAVAALQASRSDQDPSLRQLAVLAAVRDGVTSPAMIARRLRVTRPAVTGLLDRLEQRGLLRRDPDPADRRRQRVALTVAGAEAGRATQRFLADEVAAQLAAASPEELAAAERTLRLLTAVVARLEAATPVAGDTDAPLDGPEPDPAAPAGRTAIAAGTPPHATPQRRNPDPAPVRSARGRTGRVDT